MDKIAAILWCILSLAWTTASWAQNVAVSGKVTGANGEAIIGANVLVEGTTQGITTNVDGDYTLTNVPANATLVVSYLGYKTEKIPVGNKTRIDVTLREDTAEIEGVMVVAYGTAKKESFTGSAAVVKGGELQKRVVGNVTKSFEGTVAGVQVASGGGQPGPEGPAEGGAVAGAELLFHVGDEHLRHGLLVVPAAQGEQAVIPPPGVVHALHRGGGRAQHQQGVVLDAAVFGHVPGVVAGDVFRLIAALLLLVQNDEPQVGQGGEHRRAGADHHVGVPPPGPLPLVIPLPRPQGAVEDGHTLSKV